MVLIGASSEPEVAVYDRLHAGPWIDGTVQPEPNQWINIHATVRELERAPRLGRMPLIVITAGILQGEGACGGRAVLAAICLWYRPGQQA
jgi:hypothetical protein